MFLPLLIGPQVTTAQDTIPDSTIITDRFRMTTIRGMVSGRLSTETGVITGRSRIIQMDRVTTQIIMEAIISGSQIDLTSWETIKGGVGPPTTPLPPLPVDVNNLSMTSSISDMDQLDGNVSLDTSIESDVNDFVMPDKIMAALNLPKVATYNLRSMIPKIGHLKTDILERKIDCAFLQEIWQQTDNKEHQHEIEKMLQMSGLAYISCPRPPNAKGLSYGGLLL